MNQIKTVIESEYIMKNFVENVLTVCDELNISRDNITIEYDKTRHAMINITVPHHSFDIYETPFEYFDKVMSACDAEYVYEVYRNDNCIFIGNDMYNKMFFILLKTVLSQI